MAITKRRGRATEASLSAEVFNSVLVAAAEDDNVVNGPVIMAHAKNNVSGSLLPPCNARFEPQDANRLGQIGFNRISAMEGDFRGSSTQ
jgi:hypothetical protein